MARRKGEVTSRMNERDFPHIVELPLPSGGFRSQSDDMLAFHRECGIEPRRGRGWHNDEQYYVRYWASLQTKLDLTKALVLRRTPNG
jgi:hypothetical protein